jgi:hypothetical protein
MESGAQRHGVKGFDLNLRFARRERCPVCDRERDSDRVTARYNFVLDKINYKVHHLGPFPLLCDVATDPLRWIGLLEAHGTKVDPDLLVQTREEWTIYNDALSRTIEILKRS